MSELEIREVQGITIISLTADRVVADDHVLTISNAIKTLMAENPTKKILLNLGNVQSLASLMVGELILIQKQSRTNDGAFRLCSLSPTIEESLQITGICDLFEIDENEDASLAELMS